MKKTTIHIQALLLIASFALLLTSVSSHVQTVHAQSLSILATLIGGTTEGVSNVCCNGVVLDFDSINKLNPRILDGEALWLAGFTSSYNHTNEFAQGACTLGKVFPGFCIDIEEECEAASFMPFIQLVGTSQSTSCGSPGLPI